MNKKKKIARTEDVKKTLAKCIFEAKHTKTENSQLLCYKCNQKHYTKIINTDDTNTSLNFCSKCKAFNLEKNGEVAIFRTPNEEDQIAAYEKFIKTFFEANASITSSTGDKLMTLEDYIKAINQLKR